MYTYAVALYFGTHRLYGFKLTGEFIIKENLFQELGQSNHSNTIIQTMYNIKLYIL